MKYLFLIIFYYSSFIFADPFSILPSTKAKGMAGAVVSVVEDTTAGYYNPAGYTMFFRDNVINLNTIVTVEQIDIFSYNEYSYTSLKEQLSTKIKPFVGISATNSKYGFGLSVYSIYDYILKDRETTVINTYIDKTDLPTTLYPTIDFFHQKADVIQVGGAYNIFRYKQLGSIVSIGLSAGIVFAGGEYGTNTNANHIRQYKDKAKTKKYNLAFSKSVYSGHYFNASPIFGTGIKARIYDSDKYTLSIGASYKSDTKSNTKSNKETFIATSDEIRGSSILIIPSWGTPSSVSMGLSLNIKKQLGFFTLSYEHGQKNYAKATNNTQSNVSTNAYGIEASLLDANIQLRAGRYISSSENPHDISTDAMTLGISKIFPENKNIPNDLVQNLLNIATIDVSIEIKNYQAQYEKTQLNLVSFSINYEL